MFSVELGDQPKAPLVSVLICSYNAEEFVETTVRSVMNQTHRHLEILVLDNASEDGTVGVLERLCEEDPRIKLFVGRDNLGAYGGLNCLLDRAKGKYIAIQDHDDIWHREKIARQVEFLETHEEYVGCGTAIINYYEKYNKYLLRRQRDVSDIAWHTSLVFRNHDFRYNAEAKVANDFHFMRNVLCKSGERIYNLSESYVLRAIRADRSNLSTRWITFETLSDLFRLRIGIVDKLAFLNRLLLPNRIADYVVLHVLLRRNILKWSDVQHYFVDV